jgi:RimJ/RimL family protein N-acetyltransferase
MPDSPAPLVLQPLQPVHFEAVIGWVDSPQLLMQFAGPGYRYPLTANQLLASTREDYRQCYAAVWQPTGQMVGQGQMYYPSPGVARLARLIVDPQQQNRGLGTALVLALCQLAYEQGAYQAELGVKHDNFGAIRCYEKCGFVPDPTRTEHWDFFGQPAWIYYLTKSLLQPDEPL